MARPQGHGETGSDHRRGILRVRRDRLRGRRGSATSPTAPGSPPARSTPTSRTRRTSSAPRCRRDGTGSSPRSARWRIRASRRRRAPELHRDRLRQPQELPAPPARHALRIQPDEPPAGNLEKLCASLKRSSLPRGDGPPAARGGAAAAGPHPDHRGRRTVLRRACGARPRGRRDRRAEAGNGPAADGRLAWPGPFPSLPPHPARSRRCCADARIGPHPRRGLPLARKSSEAIRLSKLALEKSRLPWGGAGEAVPHVDLQASASYLVNPPPGYTVPAGALGSIPIPPTYPTTLPIPPNNFNVGAALHNYFSLTASLNQPLFTWGKIRNAIDLASLQVDAAGTDVIARQRDIERRSTAYFGALLARRSQEVLQRIRDTAAEMVADRQKSFDQGTINRESVLEAGATLASLEAKLTEAEQSESTALESLGILTGLDPRPSRWPRISARPFPPWTSRRFSPGPWRVSTTWRPPGRATSRRAGSSPSKKGARSSIPTSTLGFPSTSRVRRISRTPVHGPSATTRGTWTSSSPSG